MSKVIRNGIIFWVFAFTIVSLTLSHIIYHRKSYCRSSEMNIECSDEMIRDCSRAFTFEKMISGQEIFIACAWHQVIFYLAVFGLSVTEIALISLAFALVGKGLPEKTGYFTLASQCLLLIALIAMLRDLDSKDKSVKTEQTFVRATYYIVCFSMFCSEYIVFASWTFEYKVIFEYSGRRQRRENARRNRVAVNQTHQEREFENPQDSSETFERTNVGVINVTVNQDYDPDYDTGERI